MSVKDQIIEKLQEVYEPGDVNAGQVYKGFDYDGSIEASGWWFSFFNGQKIFLGRSLEAAKETIEDIASSRDEW